MTYELKNSEQNLGAFTLMSERYMQNVALRDWHYREEGRETAYRSYKEIAELQSYKASRVYRLISLKGERASQDSALSIGVTMIAFTILLAASYGADQVVYMREALGQRLLTTPLSKESLYLGEYLGGTIMAFFQGSCLVLALEACFHLGLGRNMGEVLLLLLSTSLMSIALGILIGIVVPHQGLSNALVSLLVLVFCFTSGGMVPTTEVGALANFSPVTLMNEGFMSICQKGSYPHLIPFLLQIGILTGGLLFMSYLVLVLKKGKRLKLFKLTGVAGALLVCLVGCGKGEDTSYTKDLTSPQASSQKLFIFHNKGQEVGEEEQLLAELKGLPVVNAIEEWRNTCEITVKTWEDKEEVIELTGLSTRGEDTLPLEAGRLFTEAEGGAPLLVVLDTYAKIMWGEERPEKLLKKRVFLEVGGEKRPFQIIGVFDTGVDLKEDLGAGTKTGVYMSLKTYERFLGASTEKGCYVLSFQEAVSGEEGYAAINEVLKHYGEKGDYTILPYLGQVTRLKLNP